MLQQEPNWKQDWLDGVDEIEPEAELTVRLETVKRGYRDAFLTWSDADVNPSRA